VRIKLPKTRARLAGPGTRLYAEPKPSPDETSFQIDNTSSQYYNSPYYLAHKDQVQSVPAPQSGVPAYLDLQDFIPSEVVDAINTAKRITFHAVGDTGAAKGVPATAIANEGGVADAMAADVQSGGANGPAGFPAKRTQAPEGGPPSRESGNYHRGSSSASFGGRQARRLGWHRKRSRYLLSGRGVVARRSPFRACAPVPALHSRRGRQTDSLYSFRLRRLRSHTAARSDSKGAVYNRRYHS